MNEFINFIQFNDIICKGKKITQGCRITDQSNVPFMLQIYNIQYNRTAQMVIVIVQHNNFRKYKLHLCCKFYNLIHNLEYTTVIYNNNFV